MCSLQSLCPCRKEPANTGPRVLSCESKAAERVNFCPVCVTGRVGLLWGHMAGVQARSSEQHLDGAVKAFCGCDVFCRLTLTNYTVSVNTGP